MHRAPIDHPSAKELSDFGLGKLPRPERESVAAHLESCTDCLAKLAEQQPDSFMGGLKAAAPNHGTVVPGEKEPASLPRKAPALADLPPELAALGKFEEVKKVGEGGMGAVWKARHVMLDKLVAIKVMNNATLGNAEARERFFTEMRAGGRLDHPNIARVIDAGRAGELLYMVMEYVEGQSLDRYVARKGPMPVHLACDLVAQAAEGLQHAHEKGMAHRDIKPANLMVTREAKVKLLDFGLVRLRDEGRGRKTQFKTFMGTADYVAPEQATNARGADIRSDVYSLGCTLYFLLSGKPPFEGESYVDVITKHLTEPPAPLTGVPGPLWGVVARAMEKDPLRRYQTPAEVAEALGPFRILAAPSDRGGAAVVPPLPIPTGPAAPSPFTGLPVVARPAREQAPIRRRGGPGRPLWLAVAVGAAVALLAAGVALTLRTKHGEVVIRLSDRAAKVEVKIDGDTIELSGLSRPLKMTVGEHGLTVVGDGFETVTKSFLVKSGARTDVEVKLVPKPAVVSKKERDAPAPEVVGKKDEPGPAPGRAPDQDGFVPLFNGKDLTGWRTLGPEEPNAWTVRDGILFGRSHNWSSLRSERADYSDFHLRVEAMVDGAGGSVRFRHPLSGEPGPFVAQLVTAGRWQTGSLLRKTLPALHCSWWSLVEVPTAAAPANTWVNLEVIAVADRVTVKVNGKTTADVRQRDNQRSGHFTLYPERGSGIRFRKIEVKELAPANVSRREFVNSVGMKMVPIPAGTFVMGLDDGHENEKPARKVEIATPFYLGAFEVSQRQFQDVMGYNPSYFSPDGAGKAGLPYLPNSRPAGGGDKVKGVWTDDFPVENVSYEEAVEFCRLLTDRERSARRIQADQEYQLPTESRWEYACRGGANTSTKYHFGDSLTPAQANFAETNLWRTCKVGSYPANAFGMHDMHGNVLEWCQADPNPSYLVMRSKGNAGHFRVMRGGALDRDANQVRSTFRVFNESEYRFRVVGFRVALVPSERVK